MSMKYQLSWINNFWVGIGAGLVLPILGFLLSKEVKLPAATLEQYWRIFITSDFQVNKEIIVFSFLPNMLLFYILFFRIKTDNSAKGLVLITLVLGALSFLLTAD